MKRKEGRKGEEEEGEREERRKGRRRKKREERRKGRKRKTIGGGKERVEEEEEREREGGGKERMKKRRKKRAGKEREMREGERDRSRKTNVIISEIPRKNKSRYSQIQGKLEMAHEAKKHLSETLTTEQLLNCYSVLCMCAVVSTECDICLLYAAYFIECWNRSLGK